MHQQHSGMKVTTEGCLFGAWVASKNLKPGSILDVGAGTGLLSLMVAQAYTDSFIAGVEVEKTVFEEAASNFRSSPFASRVQAHHCRIQDFQVENRFDLIISNPPFFSRALAASKSHEHIARHDDLLSQHDLACHADRLLSAHGKFFVLYPEKEMQSFIAVAQNFGFRLSEKLVVYSQSGGSVFREMCQFERNPKSFLKSEIVIKKDNKAYSDEFSALLKPYYLHL